MKTLFLLVALTATICQISFAQSIATAGSRTDNRDSLSFYNKRLSKEQMHADLKLFRDIREKANSGLYIYRSRKSIDSINKVALNETKRPMLTSEFYKIILRLTDFEGSVHNYTEVNVDYLNFLKTQKSFLPYALKYIEGKIIFNNPNTVIPVGSRVVSINGMSDTDIMTAFYKYYPADGFTVTEKLSASVNSSFGIRYLLEYGLTDSFNIRFIPPSAGSASEGNPLTASVAKSAAKNPAQVTLPSVTLGEREVNLKRSHSAALDSLTDFRLTPSYSFQKVDEQTGLLNLRVFSMATGVEDPAFKVYARFIDSVFNVLNSHKVPNLIIDVRGNPGGSDPTFEEPMMYLTDHSFKENTLAYTIFDEVPYEQYFWGVSTDHKMAAQELEQGKLFLKDRFPKLVNGKNPQAQKHNPVYHPKNPAYNGKVYLLIDERVASAASHFASLVKGYARNATIVGVETCGGYYVHNGHIPLVYQLPNSKIKTKFSIVHVVQDAPVKPDQPAGRGIIPDYEVWQSFDDFMNNRDTQMEFVKKLIAGGR